MPNIPGVGGRKSFLGPFMREKAQAAQRHASDDDSDYEGTCSAMHTS